VEEAIQILLSNGGKHVSPLPQPIEDAFNIVNRFDPPVHELTKYYTDGSVYTEHVFRRFNLIWIFWSFTGGENKNGENKFFLKK
jgi:hypothetical protein